MALARLTHVTDMRCEQRSASITDRPSALRFLDRFVVHEFFVPDYFENEFYSPAGVTGSPFGSAILGPAKVLDRTFADSEYEMNCASEKLIRMQDGR